MNTEKYAKEHPVLDEFQGSSGEMQAWSHRRLEPTSESQWQLLAAPYTPAQEGVVETELALSFT